MYIRRTKTKTAEHGDDSYTYRIVESVREGMQVKQLALLKLGKDDDVGQLLEATAERYSDLIIAKLAQPVAIATPEADYHRVNINHIEAAQARSIGAETLACHAVRQLQLDQIRNSPRSVLIKSIPQRHWAVL